MHEAAQSSLLMLAVSIKTDHCYLSQGHAAAAYLEQHACRQSFYPETRCKRWVLVRIYFSYCYLTFQACTHFIELWCQHLAWSTAVNRRTQQDGMHVLDLKHQQGVLNYSTSVLQVQQQTNLRGSKL
jgi:hypothetical protein